MNEQDAWQGARNILCIRLDYLGDVLMTTPAMRALKATPAHRITLLTSPGGAAVVPYLPEIDDTIVYAAPWLKHGGPADPAADLAMIETLRSRSFDAAVIFTVYSQNPQPAALLCHLAGIPLRLAHCRENPYRLLTHWVRETEPEQQVRHEVRRQLDLVATVGAHCEDERMSFKVKAEDAASVQALLAERGIGERFIVLHPGASAASRRYPPEHFREAARALAARSGHALVFTGSSGEAELIEQICAGLPQAHSLAGVLTLGQLGALIAQAPLVVSNNTGPAHMAAALGTPVVDLYALTNPQHTPWQVPARVLYQDVPCRYCYRSVCPEGHHACLRGVAPEQVVQAALELLGGARDSGPALPPLQACSPAASVVSFAKPVVSSLPARRNAA
ncbi:MAG TPA: lipopolysaccharide heptosyltransferase II [Noviherbaspirillum sp.]